MLPREDIQVRSSSTSPRTVPKAHALFSKEKLQKSRKERRVTRAGSPRERNRRISFFKTSHFCEGLKSFGYITETEK